MLFQLVSIAATSEWHLTSKRFVVNGTLADDCTWDVVILLFLSEGCDDLVLILGIVVRPLLIQFSAVSGSMHLSFSFLILSQSHQMFSPRSWRALKKHGFISGVRQVRSLDIDSFHSAVCVHGYR